MDEKLHVIVCNSGVEQIWDIEEETCVVSYAFKGRKSKLLSVIRKFWLNRRLPMKEIWYDKNVLQLRGTGVLMDSDVTEDYAEWLIEKNRNVKWNFFYWNSCESCRIKPETIKKLGYDVWSFDPDNCRQFSMKFNPEFFCKSWYKDLKCDRRPKYDVIFIGRDKNGRMDEVMELVKRYKKYDISWNLYFTANKWYQRFKRREYRPYLNFKEMLELEMDANAILDFSQNIQNSITCRTYDALCNRKKVITNNLNIKKMKYYTSENIFVINDDDDERLEQFLKTPFQPIPWEALREHSCERWSRVIREGESYVSDIRCSANL